MVCDIFFFFFLSQLCVSQFQASCYCRSITNKSSRGASQISPSRTCVMLIALLA